MFAAIRLFLFKGITVVERRGFILFHPVFLVPNYLQKAPEAIICYIFDIQDIWLSYPKCHLHSNGIAKEVFVKKDGGEGNEEQEIGG